MLGWTLSILSCPAAVLLLTSEGRTNDRSFASDGPETYFSFERNAETERYLFLMTPLL
jgi:hypothetical protein